MEKTTKTKWPYADALAVAQSLKSRLERFCSRIEIAGSLRREKSMVGDIELLYVSLAHTVPVSLFGEKTEIPLVDSALKIMLGDGTLEKRKNSKGHETFGDKIKLLRHVASGIPVDLFSTNEESWWNYLVCRTGPAESNIRICQEAIALGFKWEPYSSGFKRADSDERSPRMESEKDVFDFVGLALLPPHKR